MKKIFCVIVAALCVAFVLTAPAFIASGIGKSIYEVRQDERQTRFQGKISLWHVVSFKTPRSSGYSLLKNRMRELEKQLPYVYIDVEGMTLEDARARMAAGERPDVISYPAGAFDEKGMMGLERRRVLSYAAQDGRAYPYCCRNLFGTLFVTEFLKKDCRRQKAVCSSPVNLGLSGKNAKSIRKV